MIKYALQGFFIDFRKKVIYLSIMSRKPLATRIENDLQKEIKKLGIDLERALNDLLEEAIRDLLEKYRLKGNLTGNSR